MALSPKPAYPPAWLRIRFHFEFLAEIEPHFSAEMGSAREGWMPNFPEGPIDFLNDLKTLVVAFKNLSLPRLGKVSEQDGSGRFGFGMREYLFARDQSSFWLPDQPNPQPVNETEMRFWLPPCG
jgi:hypothetical protein